MEAKLGGATEDACAVKNAGYNGSEGYTHTSVCQSKCLLVDYLITYLAVDNVPLGGLKQWSLRNKHGSLLIRL